MRQNQMDLRVKQMDLQIVAFVFCLFAFLLFWFPLETARTDSRLPRTHLERVEFQGRASARNEASCAGLRFPIGWAHGAHSRESLGFQNISGLEFPCFAGDIWSEPRAAGMKVRFPPPFRQAKLWNPGRLCRRKMLRRWLAEHLEELQIEREKGCVSQSEAVPWST